MSLHNSICRKEEKAKNIQVVVRCRPFNAVERKSASHPVIECDQTRREVFVRTGGIGDKSAKKTYTFDMVFGPAAKQIEVYRSVVFPILDEVIMGYNCTVFAYGQTGTGKTFTMEGERSPNEEFTWEEDPLAGVIPRTLHQIFEKLSDNGTEFSVKVSLLEIYNEELFDLLSPSADVTERLQMFDDPRNKRGVIIKGLEEVTVHNKDEVYQILERGAAKRKTASTLLNAYSSRSHSVFSITIHMKETTIDGEELVKIGKLNLVDLAGSENIGRSGAVDKRAREAGNINQSLLTLGRVITALVERTPHVPYRESKLTRILQDSLGGRTKTSIIATVSPASINLEETLSTLDYANRAKNILNKPEVNQKLTKRALIKEYTEEIERLKRDLAAAREKNGVYLSNDNFEIMNSRLASQEEQITEFTEKIFSLEEEIKKVLEMFSDKKQALEQCAEDLQGVREELEEAQKDLSHTAQRLGEEEFVVLQLESTESRLYSTAGQLLSTVEKSTKDVSGLHEKLERKKRVEQHNNEVQQSFGHLMEGVFRQLQESVQEHSVRHGSMLDSYAASVSNLLSVNNAAFKETTSTMASSFKTVAELVSSSVTRCQSSLDQQESLCQSTRDKLQQALEEHRAEMEEGLLAVMLPAVNAVNEINKSLTESLQSYTLLAHKMESMKQEMVLFFSHHTQALAAMRESALNSFNSLHAQHNGIKEQISRANMKHKTGLSEVITSLQKQLNLLALETNNDFTELLSQSEAFQEPVAVLQQNLQMQCTAAEQSIASHCSLLETSAEGMLCDLKQAANAGREATEESSGQCTFVKNCLTQLAETAEHWCETTKGHVTDGTQKQLATVQACRGIAENLKLAVQSACSDSLQQMREQLTCQQTGVEGILTGLEKQLGSDRSTLQSHATQLNSDTSNGLAKVHAFLQEELRHDVPTGTTPQRTDYSYPRVLAKSRPRSELVDFFRQQQQELQAALSVCEPVNEEPVNHEQQSFEEEQEESHCNESDFSYYEESTMCNEIGRVPFFKSNKAKKENKSFLDQSKVAEEKLTPQRSKLPLRVQN